MAKSLRAVWLILVTLGMTGGMNHRIHAQAPAAPRYDATLISCSLAYDLNNKGQVLVSCDDPADRDLFLWTPTTLERLPGTATLNAPLRMNDLGDNRPWIAGNVGSLSDYRATRWSPGGGLVPVPSPFPAHDDLGVYYVNPASLYVSASYGINNNGDIALTAVGGDYGLAGIVWSASGNLTLPYYTWLTGINDSGQAIGKNYYPGPPYVDSNRWPLAINDSGIVVGWDLDADPNGQVFRWSLANGFENLSTPSGHFPGGGGMPLGTPTMDINAAGNIVATTQGNYQAGPYVYGERAFLYYQDGVCELQQPLPGEPSACWRPLDDLVVSLHIRNTLAINDRGQILVEASQTGLEGREYYLLTPAAPAPSNHPPVVNIVGTLNPAVPLAPGPFSLNENKTPLGTPLTLFADATDPDGDALTFDWRLVSGTGLLYDPFDVNRNYRTYTNGDGPAQAVVRVTVTDSHGATASAETTINVANVAPEVSPANPLPSPVVTGQTFVATGSFFDPGADQPWTATIDFGDGSGQQTLNLDVPGFCCTGTYSMSHVYVWRGTYKITVRVTDKDGGIGTSIVPITVTQPPDRTPPVIDDIQPSSLVLWPPNHKMIPVLLKVSAHDDRDPAPTCSIVGITSNEPENGWGNGDTAPDAVQTGPLSVQLRAERAGAGRGRVYTISVQCSDTASNSSVRTVNIIVPHDQRK